jgi:oligopeptidase A
VLLADAKAAVDYAAAPETPATWKDIIESEEHASERFSRAWGVIGHLNAVADTPELRAAHAENLPRVTEFISKRRTEFSALREVQGHRRRAANMQH